MAKGKHPRLATQHFQRKKGLRRDARSWRNGRTRPLEVSSGGLPALWVEFQPISLGAWAWLAFFADLVRGCGSRGEPATCGGSHGLQTWPCTTWRRGARLKFGWGGGQVEKILHSHEILDATSCGQFEP